MLIKSTKEILNEAAETMRPADTDLCNGSRIPPHVIHSAEYWGSEVRKMETVPVLTEGTA